MKWFQPFVWAVLVLGFLAPASRSGEPRQDSMPDADLRKLLVGLGYEVEDIKATDGSFIYRTTWKSDGWTYVADVSTASKGKIVWLVMRFGVIDDLTKMPPNVALDLLGANEETGLSYFSFAAKAKRIYLNDPMDFRTVTPASLHKEFDFLAATAKKTENLWNPEKWKK